MVMASAVLGAFSVAVIAFGCSLGLLFLRFGVLAGALGGFQDALGGLLGAFLGLFRVILRFFVMILRFQKEFPSSRHMKIRY